MPLLQVVAAAPVVDIDGTFFIMGGMYLALVFILNPLLFKPWLMAQARRKEAIEGSVVKAKALRGDADAMAGEYDQRLADARDRAATLRSKARREEEAVQAKKLADARATASDELSRTRERLATEADQARQALGARVDELADQISQKILGRAS
jgi:F-type H+-transporting ATPase subunit b